MFHSIRWRIATAFTLLIMVIIAGLSIYLVHLFKESYLDEVRAHLTSQARLIGDSSAPYFAPGREDGMDALAKRLGGNIGARVTIIRKDGVVLGDSETDPATMENHAARPEVIEALSQGAGSNIRYSATLGYDMIYVAVPVRIGGSIAGIARVSLHLADIDKTMGRIARTIVWGALGAAVIAIMLALQISRITTEHVKQLTHMSKRMADGELDQEIRVTSRDEVSELARAFNQMALRLKDMVSALTGERDKMGAILSAMSDAILVVDIEGRVTMVNSAAEKTFGLAGDKAMGLPFIEAVRDHELDDMLKKCLKTGGPQRGMVETAPGKRSLGMIATPLGGGALVLLQDLTEFRRLEMVRQDFVSNISHELRTPIASLKAITETLQDGALHDEAAARDFLHKMHVEVDRLTQIVNELGELSRIESGRVPLKIRPVAPGEVLRKVADRLGAQAERGGLRLDLDIPPDLPEVPADEERVAQVLVNLSHNAIKFTPPRGRITLSARVEGNNIVVSVADTGMGISASDLPRIFERFYKAVKARSGGGRGLGLAIARHVVQAHGGN
ncbi:MAG: ATP-binding protein, partial [Dehalococcoidia bacterium]|nr:ATP-binding protein [Dehalococcoidia bacterium]